MKHVEWVGIRCNAWERGMVVGYCIKRGRVLASRGRWVWVQLGTREPQTWDRAKLEPDPGKGAGKVVRT